MFDSVQSKWISGRDHKLTGMKLVSFTFPTRVVEDNGNKVYHQAGNPDVRSTDELTFQRLDNFRVFVPDDTLIPNGDSFRGEAPPQPMRNLCATIPCT